MITQDYLNVSICTREPLRVIFRQCSFRDSLRNRSQCIQRTFDFLRQWSTCMGLNTAELIEVGIPVLEGDQLASYTCCLEYVLPTIDENADVSLGELPGGRYAVLRVEKSHIEHAVWQLRSIYMPENGLVQDPHRPVYEVFNGHELEYCVPLV